MTHVVIGGGIIGLLTAHYLQAAGERVTLLEQGLLGKESSWAGGGILSPLYPWHYPEAVNALAWHSQRLYPNLVQEFKIQSGIDAEINTCGLMMLDPDEIDPATQWAKQHDINLQILTKEQVQQRIPAISQHCLPQHSLWMPDIAQVRNPRFLKALVASLRLRGVELIENAAVDNFVFESHRIKSVVSGDQVYPCTTATVACGAWSHQVLENWLPKLAVEPVRGQMILFKANQEILPAMLMKNAQYLIPRRDGRIIMGSTLEYTGFNKATTEDAFMLLKNAAMQLIPALADFPVEQHWAGLRPGNVRQIPFICEHPQLRGLFINTGHFRNGVVTAPASAKLLVDQILNRKEMLNPSPYRI